MLKGPYAILLKLKFSIENSSFVRENKTWNFSRQVTGNAKLYFIWKKKKNIEGKKKPGNASVFEA